MEAKYQEALRNSKNYLVWAIKQQVSSCLKALAIPAFAVDTHIHRLAQRWGLTSGKNVVQTEKDLKRIFPEKTWSKLHLQIIYYGREYCKARECYGVTCKICTTCYPNRKKPIIIRKA